jgi:hypothetical protein
MESQKSGSSRTPAFLTGRPENEEEEKTLRTARKMADSGLGRDGADLVRPLVLQKALRPDALFTLAYCLEKEGELATARYLYKQANALLDGDPGIVHDLARCETAWRQRVNEASQRRAGVFRFLVSLLLVALGGTAVVVSLTQPVADLLELVIEDVPQGIGTYTLAGGAVLLALGLLSGLLWLRRFLQGRSARRAAAGPDFSPRSEYQCSVCELLYPKNLVECPYCATPRGSQAVAPPPAEATVTPFPSEVPAEPPSAASLPDAPETPAVAHDRIDMSASHGAKEVAFPSTPPSPSLTLETLPFDFPDDVFGFEGSATEVTGETVAVSGESDSVYTEALEPPPFDLPVDSAGASQPATPADTGSVDIPFDLPTGPSAPPPPPKKTPSTPAPTTSPQPARRPSTAVPPADRTPYPWELDPAIVARAEALNEAGACKVFLSRCGEALHILTKDEAVGIAYKAEFRVYSDFVGVEGRRLTPLQQFLAILFGLPASFLAGPVGCLFALPAAILGLLFYPITLLIDLIRKAYYDRIAERIRRAPKSPYAIRKLFDLTPLIPRYFRRGEVVQLVRLEARRFLCGSRSILLLVQDAPIPRRPGCTDNLMAVYGLVRLIAKRRIYFIAFDKGESEADRAAAEASRALGIATVDRAAFVGKKNVLEIP